jgi:protoporphyrinogen/coproporphyrinogen III oxidase
MLRALHVPDEQIPPDLEVAAPPEAGQVPGDLHRTMGLMGSPIDLRVKKFWNGFPQPRPGHAAAVAEIETMLAEDVPGVALAGNWLHGVGIPACIASGRAAAARLLAR